MLVQHSPPVLPSLTLIFSPAVPWSCNNATYFGSCAECGCEPLLASVSVSD